MAIIDDDFEWYLNSDELEKFHKLDYSHLQISLEALKKELFYWEHQLVRLNGMCKNYY